MCVLPVTVTEFWEILSTDPEDPAASGDVTGKSNGPPHEKPHPKGDPI